jgi:hypothetical protein
VPPLETVNLKKVVLIMRITLANHSEVAHYWANRVQPEGRAGNMFFEGEDIYSYGTHFKIASFVKHDVVFFNSKSYSVSTSKHQSLTRAAIPSYCIVFEIADFENHLENVKYYLEQVKALRLKAMRARVYKESYLREAKRVVLELKDYLEMFKVSGLSRNTKEHIKNLISNVDNILPEEVENALKEQGRQEKQAKERALKKDINDWQNGVKNYLSHGLQYAYLRIKNDVIQTSKGATVSLKSARVLWQRFNAGKPIKGIRLDDRYTVIGLADNILKIGCHNIKMSEVNRLAKKLGWNNLPTTDRAEMQG